MYADGGQLIWQQSFIGNTISGSIPASLITENLNIESVNFARVNELPIQKPIYPGTSSTKVTPEIQALIISPDPLLFKLDIVRTWVEEAFEARGIKYKELVHKTAIWDNVAKFGRYGNIKYVYLMAHGSYYQENTFPIVYRTGTQLFDGRIVSCKQSDFVHAPGWCVPFNGEQRINTWASMGFDKLEFFL